MLFCHVAEKSCWMPWIYTVNSRVVRLRRSLVETRAGITRATICRRRGSSKIRYSADVGVSLSINDELRSWDTKWKWFVTSLLGLVVVRGDYVSRADFLLNLRICTLGSCNNATQGKCHTFFVDDFQLPAWRVIRNSSKRPSHENSTGQLLDSFNQLINVNYGSLAEGNWRTWSRHPVAAAAIKRVNQYWRSKANWRYQEEEDDARKSRWTITIPEQ